MGSAVEPSHSITSQVPLVSCIVPTRNRARYIGLALRSFLAQTYPRKELVVVDNGDDVTEDIVHQMIPSTQLRYHHVDGFRTTGEMRNLCNELAQGEFICHFDSDDWSAPDRITHQMQLIAQRVLTGYSTMLFYEESTKQGYQWYTDRIFALGTSLCYRRAWWISHPFSALRIGEDFRFFQIALKSHQVVLEKGQQRMVALVHPHQTSRKSLRPPRYQKIHPTCIPQQFLCDLTLSLI